jgi:SSS family solute:Na+ symporter
MHFIAMTAWGLDVYDLAVILLFLIVLLVIGLGSSRTVKKESDFYLGGRKLGRGLQFFLNFGNSTDSTGAVQVATAVYSQGAGGIWVGGFQTLFITPFFWFTQPWWRRARLVTMGDLFVDRYNSKALASAYAGFSIFMALFNMGMGNFFAYKVAHAMIVKPAIEYTDEDRQEIATYEEFQALKTRVDAGEKQLLESERYKSLDSQNKRGELHSFISYVQPLPFYVAYSAIVGTYIALGGLRAAAITDALQGLLILVMSLLLIPMGLHRIGGLSGLHELVPAVKFNVATAWYAVAAITFASLVQIVGLMHNMSTAGSARNENTARFGMISGGFTKRLVLIAWMFCGLIGIAVLRGNLKLADPDNAWGALSKQLLAPGLLGLMLSGMLLGHMPSVGVYAVSVAGLATRNLYQPLFPGRSEKHYLRFGQFAVAGILLVAIIFALISTNVISAYTMLVTFNTFFGAAILLILFWRRLTAASILLGLFVWIVVMGLIPWILPCFPAFRRAEPLLMQNTQTPPTAVFFDSVARIRPLDPLSPLEGIGRFNVENYCLSCVGVPVRDFNADQMTASRWAFDGLFPFVSLILLSLITKPSELARADRFFAKMRTPVAPTPEEDAAQVQASYADPHRFDDSKIFRGSQWQFTKWSATDWIGFGGCWGIVLLILGVLWGVLHLGT